MTKVIQEYIDQQKSIQKGILDFINHDVGEKVYYLNLLKVLDDPSIHKSQSELSTTLRLLLDLANNHHRMPNFFKKIEQILILFKDYVKQNFSNFELFNICKKNKEILLILLENKMLEFDQSIIDKITETKYLQLRYPYYFSPECQNFNIDSKILLEIQTKMADANKEGPEAFDKKRKAGENSLQYCQYIREDSLEDFISYVNEHKLPLSTVIEPSIFETNNFLIQKTPTLIEYAAFFGSMRIINYLLENNVQMPPSIWLYAIHSQSMDLLHLIEEKKVQPNDQSYNECFIEAVKCHHIEMSEYFKTVYLHNQIPDDSSVTSQIIKFRNYLYFPSDLSTPSNFYDLSKYDYYKIVDFLLTHVANIDTNRRVISKIVSFCK